MSALFLEQAISKIAKKENMIMMEMNEIINLCPKDWKSKDWDRLQNLYSLQFEELWALQRKVLGLSDFAGFFRQYILSLIIRNFCYCKFFILSFYKY